MRAKTGVVYRTILIVLVALGLVGGLASCSSSSSDTGDTTADDVIEGDAGGSDAVSDDTTAPEDTTTGETVQYNHSITIATPVDGSLLTDPMQTVTVAYSWDDGMPEEADVVLLVGPSEKARIPAIMEAGAQTEVFEDVDFSTYLARAYPALLGAQLVAPDGTVLAQSEVVSLRFTRTAVELETLDDRSEVPVRLRMQDGMVESLRGQIPIEGEDPLDAAYAFFEDFSGLFQLENPREQLFVDRIKTDPDDNEEGYFVFQQRHLGIPILGAHIVMRLHGYNVRHVHGGYTLSKPRLPSKTIGPARARAVAVAGTGADSHAVGDPRLEYFEPRLILPASRWDSESPEMRLCWLIRVEGYDESLGTINLWDVYVDAEDETIHLRESQMRPGLDCTPPYSEMDLDIIDANQTSSDTCFYFDWWYNDTDDLCDEDGCDPSTPDNGWDSYTNSQIVYNWYRNELCRKSWGGDDEQMESYVYYGSVDWNNASWACVCNSVYLGWGFAELDIIAHEFTHGVNDDENDLVYRYESGALDEALADTFAALIEGHELGIGMDNEIGEDIIRHNGSQYVMRDITDPHGAADWQPEHYDEILDMSDDHGGVHYNCSIPELAMWLMANGGSHRGIDVVGIGIDKMARIVHDVQRWDITKSTKFHTFARYVVERTQLYADEDKYGVTDNDVCQTIQAFSSVGLVSPDLDCDGIPDDEDTDDDRDGHPDDEDNCPRIINPLQHNVDGDEFGDACDDDIDNDTVLNEDDNCVEDANATQTDTDGNGIGDACDDRDGDTHGDLEDNCPDTSNYYQGDLDGDDIGDACDDDDDGDSKPDDTDNCPATPNFNQANSDGDRFGDACDTCPGMTSDIQTDTDGDGFGNPCDDDDDDDGILDEDDNCPEVWNQDQVDFDENGIGTECDNVEQTRAFMARLDAGMEIIVALAEMEEARRGARLPVPICQGGCDHWRGTAHTIQVEFSANRTVPVTLVDQFGNRVGYQVAASPAPGYETGIALAFQPQGLTRTFDRAQRTLVPLGNTYYLEFGMTSEMMEGGTINGFFEVHE